MLIINVMYESYVVLFNKKFLRLFERILSCKIRKDKEKIMW